MKGQALLPADGMMATAKSELNSGLRHVPVGSKERIHLDLNVSNATRCRRLMCAEVCPFLRSNYLAVDCGRRDNGLTR